MRSGTIDLSGHTSLTYKAAACGHVVGMRIKIPVGKRPNAHMVMGCPQCAGKRRHFYITYRPLTGQGRIYERASA